MKRFAVVFTALLLSQLAFAQTPSIIIHSFQDTSCGAWTASTAEPSARAVYVYWFRGFVSGYNFGNPRHQIGLSVMPDNETLSLFVDKYCREHPLNPFISAAFPLVRQLTHATKATAN